MSGSVMNSALSHTCRQFRGYRRHIYMANVVEKLENIVREGAFGNGWLLRILPASNSGKGPQYQSALEFFEVDLVTEYGKINKVPVVVKIQVGDEMRRKVSDSTNQFMNEVAMYKTILPKLGAAESELSPKMFYGIATASNDSNADIIVLEDLRPQGFKVASDMFLDCDHVLLTMKKLGELHGLSYKTKKSCSVQVLADVLVPVKFENVDGMCDASIFRAFKTLLETSPDYSVVKRAYTKLSKQNGDDLAITLRKPEEPFAVILHGDFNRNNLLYKYDENGKVVNVKMFDFAFSNYGDPTADISFFLYLNTSKDLRDKHWDEFFVAYWDGVVSVAEDPGFTFEQFKKNFAKKALSGFISCSYFLPTLMDTESVITGEFFSKTAQERVDILMTAGGKEGTAAISDIVRHLLDMGYLEEYLLHF